MESKKWVDYPAEECPVCGAYNSKVRTKSNDRNIIYDGEEARCFDCDHTGYVVVEDSECADIVWDDTETNPQ